MYKRSPPRRAVQKVFRRHKGLALYLPGSPWLALLAGVSAGALYLARRSTYALWLLALGLLPLFKMLQLYLSWQRYSVVATAGKHTLIEYTGLFNKQERRIPLTDFSSIESYRPWWARMLHIDVGDAVLNAMGGPFELRGMGEFDSLWAAITSQGQSLVKDQPAAPPEPPAPLSPAHAARPVEVPLLEPQVQPIQVVQLLALSAPAPREDYAYQGRVFSPFIPSYPGFYAFCEQFLFLECNWSAECYRTPNPNRRYYRDGISPSLAQAYLDVLRETCILIPGRNGTAPDRVSCRIQSIRDIQRLLPDLSTRIGQAA
jgi:hypothetical protein